MGNKDGERAFERVYYNMQKRWKRVDIRTGELSGRDMYVPGRK